MSYCRWSSMNFKCELYAYESEEGFVIHVAGNKVVGDVPPLADFFGDMDEFLRSMVVQHKFLETAERRNIGLEDDGKSFICENLESFKEKLLELRAKGYTFPDYVLEDVEQEIREQI